MKQTKKIMLATLAFFAGTILCSAVDLSAYKPVDPAKNLLKNGGFEEFIANKNWITFWGKCSDSVVRDTTVKHSGEASLKIGNVPGGYSSVVFYMGNIADLKNDILVRGWVKSENIAGAKSTMQSFLQTR